MTQTDPIDPRGAAPEDIRSIPQLAAALSCPLEAIYALLLRAGAPGASAPGASARQPRQLDARWAAEILRCSPEAIEALLSRPRAAGRREHVPRRRRDYPFDPASVRRLYLEEGGTLRGVARQLNTSLGMLLDAMDEWQIPRRRPGPRPRQG